MIEIELECRPPVRCGSVDLVVDSLLSTFINVEVIPQTQCSGISEARWSICAIVVRVTDVSRTLRVLFRILRIPGLLQTPPLEPVHVSIGVAGVKVFSYLVIGEGSVRKLLIQDGEPNDLACA